MDRSREPRPAYMYDMDDETGKKVSGTKRSAKAKVSHRDEDDQRDVGIERRLSRRQPSYAEEDAEEDMRIAKQQARQKQIQQQEQRQLAEQEDVKLQRRNSKASPRKSDRQPTAHECRDYPHLPQIDTSYQQHHQRNSYNPHMMSAPSPLGPGPGPMQQGIPIRPRPQSTQTFPVRNSGYMTPSVQPNYGPPISQSAYYLPPHMAAPSFPPPSPSAYQRFVQIPTGGGNGDYFTPQATSRPLSSRFEPPVSRTQSAFGGTGPFAPPPPQSNYDPVPRTTSAFGQQDHRSRALVHSTYQDEGFYDDPYSSASGGMAGGRQELRNSIRVPSQAFTQQELDYQNMPPPARPRILRRPATDYPASSEYTIEPSDSRQERRRSRIYYDEPAPLRRQDTHRHSVSYDLGPEIVTVEAANNGRRRQSSYETPGSSSAASSSYQEKMNKAKSYQEDVAGPTTLLTAESLKKQQRRQAGSRSSTKSSASRDESDYKRSVTTKTTRSGSNEDENATIKVTGKARVILGNIAIDCVEGGEIEITHNKNFGDDRTQRSSSDYAPPSRFEEPVRERRSRADRPPPARMTTQPRRSYSQSRPKPQPRYDDSEPWL